MLIDTVFCAVATFVLSYWKCVLLAVAVGKAADVRIVVQHKRPVGNTQEFTSIAAQDRSWTVR